MVPFQTISISRELVSPEQILVQFNESLSSVMNFIDRQETRMAVVVDEKKGIKGIVSDGDIRRAILRGYALTTSIQEIMNTSPLFIPIKKSIQKNKGELMRFLNSYIYEEAFIKEIYNRIKSGMIFVAIVCKETKELLGAIRVFVADEGIVDQSISLNRTITSFQAPVKNVLVIGGAGYIGTHLVDLLVADGKEVKVLDNFLWGKETKDLWEDHPKVEVIEGDVRHIETVVESIKSVDAVCHLAAIVGDPAAGLDFKTTLATNYLSTIEIAEVCKYFQVNRLIFASTCSVYGASPKKVVLTEESPLNPISTYARTKIEAEKALLNMMSENFAPTILRKATVYGVSERMRFDLVANLFAANAFTKGEITIFGGDQWRPFLHVRDAARAYLDVISAPISKVRGQIFNLGNSSENYQIQQVAEIVKEFLPETILQVKETQQDKRNYFVNFDKIKSVLNYQTTKTVWDGIKELIENFQQGEFKNWEDSKYSNFKMFKELYLPLDSDW